MKLLRSSYGGPEVSISPIIGIVSENQFLQSNQALRRDMGTLDTGIIPRLDSYEIDLTKNSLVRFSQIQR